MTYHDYANCSVCGGMVEEIRTQTELRYGDKLVVFDNVPVGVCSGCGEEYFRADVHEKMIDLLGREPKRTVEIPLYDFDDAERKRASRAGRKKSPGSAPLQRDDTPEEEVQLATDEELDELMEMNWDEEDPDDE